MDDEIVLTFLTPFGASCATAHSRWPLGNLTHTLYVTWALLLRKNAALRLFLGHEVAGGADFEWLHAT
jgi:hypothetical protein